MGYYIDLKKITLEEYRDKLASAYLPPSRMVLKENLMERFGVFEKMRIKNAEGLLQLLSKKDRFAELSTVECFPEGYITILLRELNSTFPKPNKLAEFTGISKKAIEKLAEIGIKNTEKLYYCVLTKTDRQKLADTTGIDDAEILKLTKLTDLSRIKWVGVTYAQILLAIGVDSVEKVSKSEPQELHRRINQFILENQIYKGQIGLNDIKILIESAGELLSEIS